MSKFFGYDSTTGSDTFNFKGTLTSDSTSTGTSTCTSQKVTSLGVGTEGHPAICNSAGTLTVDSGVVTNNMLLQGMSTTPVLFTTNGSNCSVYEMVVLVVEQVAGYSQVGSFTLCSYMNGGAQNIAGYDASPNLTITSPNTTTCNVALPAGKTLVFTIAANTNISIALAANPTNPTYISLKYTGLKSQGMLTPN